MSRGSIVTSLAETRSVPPPGMACFALMTRLSMTCPICPSSTLTGERSSAISNSQQTFEPLSANSADPRSRGARSATRRTGMPPRENVASWATSFCARSAAAWMSESTSCWRSGRLAVSANDRFPTIAARMLLKSWATPPASTPNESSLLSRIRSSSIRFRSVTFRTSTMIRSSCSGTSRASYHWRAPCTSRAYSVVTGACVWRIARRASSNRSATSFAGTAWIFLPTSSAFGWTTSLEPAGWHPRIVPSASILKIRSGIACTTVRISDVAWISSCELSSSERSSMRRSASNSR